MAERQRSKNGSRETEAFLKDGPAPSQGGRFQGNLERKVGTRDERKQAVGSGGKSRVRKSDEKGQGGLGGHHGTGRD